MTAGNRSAVTDGRPAPLPGSPPGGLPPGRQLTLLLGLVLYLLATGRWGSHVSLPGVPVFVSDVFVAAAAVQTARALRCHGTRLDDLRRAARTADLALLLVGSFLGWVLLRALLGAGSFIDEPLPTLRDLAPYAYAGVALLAYLLPSAADGPRLRRLVYSALTVHLVWALGAPLLPGWPGGWPTLGELAIFTTRPDYDSAVFGVAVALALHDLLAPGRVMRSQRTVLLVLTVVGNGYALVDSPTRAGLLAGLVCVGAVLAAWVMNARRVAATQQPRRRVRNTVLVVAAAAALLGTIWVSPPGQRLVDSVSGGQTSAAGTLEARRYTWSGVTRYVLSDARRTAVGVGFGPDFITDSGTSFALEGTEYKDVRSPHNYLIGTLARLGVAGALLAAGVLLSAAALALGSLTGRPGTVTILAALVVLALPVTALLGVILESPFGAIPYFWAVGHLARERADRRASGGDALPVPPIRGRQAVPQPDLGLPAERLDS